MTVCTILHLWYWYVARLRGRSVDISLGAQSMRKRTIANAMYRTLKAKRLGRRRVFRFVWWFRVVYVRREVTGSECSKSCHSLDGHTHTSWAHGAEALARAELGRAWRGHTAVLEVHGVGRVASPPHGSTGHGQRAGSAIWAGRLAASRRPTAHRTWR